MLKLVAAAVVAALLTVAWSPTFCTSESIAPASYLQSYDFDFMAEPTLEEVLQGGCDSITESILKLPCLVFKK